MKRPWRSHYTRDWRLDPFVRGLPLDERMVYQELLDIAWDENGLRAEWVETGEFVAKQIGLSPARFLRIWHRLREKFSEIRPGLWSNTRLEDERERAEKFSESQSKKGKLRHSGSAAAQPNGYDSAQPSQSHTQSHTQHTTEETDPPAPAEPEFKFDFDALYELYPRKRGKAQGLRACKRQIRTQEEYDRCREAIAALIAEKRDPQYTPYFSTFISQRRFEDSAETARPPEGGRQRNLGYTPPIPPHKETRLVKL